MHPILSFALSGLVLTSSAFASLSPRSPSAQSTVLKPIDIRDFETASGLERRSGSEDFSDLDTTTQAELIYGSLGENGQLLLANMTLYAEDGLELVLMERFEGLTSSVDCNGDDGTLSLTFSSQAAFKYALQQWDFINHSDNGSFLLIANHDGCGPDGERQPYIVSKVTEDTASMTTLLTAKAAPWEDVTGTFDIDFGHITPYKKTAALRERGIGDDLLGNFDESKTATFDISAGTKGQRTNLYQNDKLTLDCVNCYTTGSFAVTGHISTHHWSLKELTLSANPQNFQADLEMEAKITASTSPASLQMEKPVVPDLPIPGAGISIPGIFDLGATVAYDVGFTSSIQGTAVVDFGVSAGLPDSAQLTANLLTPDDSSATGFSGGTMTPSFDVKNLSASVTFSPYSKPKIQFGLEITKIGKATIDIGVKVPEIDITLTAAYAQAGVCPNDPSTTGVKLDSKLDIEVDLDITTELGSSSLPSWSKTLFKDTKDLFSKCYPLQIPGLAPSSTAIPTLSSTLVSTQPPSVTATPVYSASGVSVVPIVNGSSIIIAPSGVSISSGVLATGTGGAPLSSSNPPYPYSSRASGVASATGTGSLPASSGIVSASGFASSTGTTSLGTAAPSLTSLPSASGTFSGPPASSGTLGVLRRGDSGLKSPLIPRAAKDSDGCTMASRFGKRVLVC